MAPSCVNTAAMRALMPRSSTLGAASARYFDDARRRNVDMSVPRLRDCSGGTNRSNAQPQRCGSSPVNTRSGTVPVRSSKRSGNPCAPSSAKLPESSHSPTFCKPAAPVMSRSSYCTNECLSPARLPSGPSPVIPSSRHERSSTASKALCCGVSGYTRGHAATDADAEAPASDVPPPSAARRSAASSARARMYRYDARLSISGAFIPSAEHESRSSCSSLAGRRHAALTCRHVATYDASSGSTSHGKSDSAGVPYAATERRSLAAVASGLGSFATPANAHHNCASSGVGCDSETHKSASLHTSAYRLARNRERVR